MKETFKDYYKYVEEHPEAETIPVTQEERDIYDLLLGGPTADALSFQGIPLEIVPK